MSRIVIDIYSNSAYKMIASKLKKLKTTSGLLELGEYMFPGPTGWFKLILDTTKTEAEVELWMYNLKLPPGCAGWEYGISEAT